MSHRVEILCIGFWVISFAMSTTMAKSRDPFVLDKSFVCNIKRSCVECLRLVHCSWCESENKCFSKQLPAFEGFCTNDTMDYEDKGFSLQENAECSCGSSDMKYNCHPSSVEEGEACNGRGECVCGRCVCNVNPDLEHPTKQIVGEYCEYDNFSCDGPHCNEGPYLFQSKANKEISEAAVDAEEPSEVE